MLNILYFGLFHFVTWATNQPQTVTESEQIPQWTKVRLKVTELEQIPYYNCKGKRLIYNSNRCFRLSQIVMKLKS